MKPKLFTDEEWTKLSVDLSPDKRQRVSSATLKIRRVFHPVRGEETQLVLMHTVSSGPEAKQQRNYYYEAQIDLAPELASKIANVIDPRRTQ